MHSVVILLLIKCSSLSVLDMLLSLSYYAISPWRILTLFLKRLACSCMYCHDVFGATGMNWSLYFIPVHCIWHVTLNTSLWPTVTDIDVSLSVSIIICSHILTSSFVCVHVTCLVPVVINRIILLFVGYNIFVKSFSKFCYSVTEMHRAVCGYAEYCSLTHY